MIEAKIIEHKKYPGTNACINVKHFAAEECDRQAVNAQWLYENPDATGYIFSGGRDLCGLDPWIEIVGVDQLVKTDMIILEISSTEDMVVPPDFEVFVHKNILKRTL